MAPGPPSAPPYAFPDGLLQPLLAVSLTAVNLLRPVYGPTGADPDGADLIDFTIDYLNPAAQRMAGLPEQPGTTALGAFPDIAANGVFEFYRQTFLSGTPATFEVNYPADGLDTYFRIAAQRHGELLLVSFTGPADPLRIPDEVALRESQAREQAARAEAEAQRNRLLRVTESLPSTTFTADQTGQVLYVSPQWYAYTGMAPGAPIGDVWPQFIHPDDLPAIAREFGAALAEGRSWRYEFRLRGADGRYRWFASQGAPEPLAEAEAAGRPRQWFGSNLDIDELQQARHVLEQQDRRLNGILQQIPAMIGYTTGPDHRFAFTNPGYDTLVGHRARLGVPVAACLPEVVPQGFIDLLDGVYRTGTSYVGRETPIEFQPADGPAASYFLDFTYQPLRDEQGHPTGVLAFVVDVTERVQARQRAEAAQAELLAAAERAAVQREAFYQVFEQTPALVQLLRASDHRIEYVNPAYQQLFPGRPLVGLDLADAQPELRAQGFIALMDRVYQTGETYYGTDTPFATAPAAGQPVRTAYYNFTYQAYRENGQVAGISVFAYNVTEQVLARQEREAQREQLQAVFAQAPVAVCVFRGENAVFDVVNPPMAEMLGHPLEALVGHPFFAVMPELRAQGLPELLAEVRRTGTPYVAKEQAIQLLRHPPGAPGHYNFVYQPLFDAQHRVTGIVCVVIDVSEQVAARRVVEAREESFRLMADNVPAMLWVTDPAGQCTYLNQQWYAYTGQTAAEALGMGWTRAVHPDDAPAAGTAFLDANARRVPFYCLYRLRRRDGHYRWAIDQGLPRFGPDGAFEGIVGTVVDVHEQKLTKKLRKSRDQTQALNAELHTSNQQLTRTNVDLDNFIYTASHDLKAPISNLEGLLHLLHAELPAPVAQSDAVAPVLTRMLDSVDRFKRTIDHLTEVSKLQKEHAPAQAAVDLAAVVEDVRQDLAPLLQETNAQLTVAVADFPAILFSEKNLRSVVYNLLSNALKYRHPARRPHVDLQAHVRQGFTVLEVHDNGLGLDAAHLPKLFTMFQRFHDHVEGTGIGLFMVKRMVDNAGGRVEVHSQLGAGTTFFVHLPHAVGPAA